LNIIISIVIKININVNIIVIKDPIDDKLFHIIIKSGKIIYRRGIPFNPKKCWGKKVILVDIKIFKKLMFLQLLFIFELFNKGIQKIIIVKIEKITPIDNT
jgi:hypothetical protein